MTVAVGRGHLPQRLDGAFGAVLLHEAEDDRKQNDHGDRDRLDPVAEEGRERSCDQQDDDEYVLELFEQDRPRRNATGSLKLVRAELARRRAASATLSPSGVDFSCSKLSSTVSVCQSVPGLTSIFSVDSGSCDMDVILYKLFSGGALLGAHYFN